MKLFGVDIERVSTRYGRLFVASRDAVIGRSLKLYGEWAEDEISACSALLNDGEAIIDVGANIGTHALAYASRFPHSQVVAFEPQPLAFSLLVANVLAARLDNVHPRNCGCGTDERIAHASPDYGSVDWNIGGFSLADSPDADTGESPILLVPLDDVHLPQRVQLIKIDVEGMEEAVFSGAKRLIGRDRPIIYFEVLDIDRLRSLRPLLTDLGYELRWLQSEAFNPRNFRLNAENVWSRGETGVLAMPHSDDARVAHLNIVTWDEVAVPVIQYLAD